MPRNKSEKHPHYKTLCAYVEACEHWLQADGDVRYGILGKAVDDAWYALDPEIRRRVNRANKQINARLRRSARIVYIRNTYGL